jgi:ABC-type nitrate/sulfonate/bicarbonate transport system substrate-binding protein
MRFISKFLATTFLIGASAGVAQAMDKLTFAYVSDPTHDIALYAIRNGIVKSDLIDLELVTASIPALGQAMLGRQYDIIEVSSFVIPPAVSQGLKVQFISTYVGRQPPGPTMSIWVNKDSPLTLPEQLKGKKIATYGIGSTGVAMVRVAMAKKLGFNVALRGGDIQFVEMPAAAMPAALKTGSVDAATLLYAQTDQALRTGEFRPLFQGGAVLKELSGVPMVLPVVIAFPDRIAAAPAAYREFNRMLMASLIYASEHSELCVSIAKQAQIAESAPYLQSMINAIQPVKRTPVGADEIKAINYSWTVAKSVGLLENVKEMPDALALVWPEALQAID